MLSSNMKNEQQTTFHKKVTSKRRCKNQAFYAFTYTRLSSMVSNIFWWNFLEIFSKVLNSALNSACWDTHFLFFQRLFWGLTSTFGKLWSQKRKKQLTILNFLFYKCVLEFYCALIFWWITLIFFKADVITVPYYACTKHW